MIFFSQSDGQVQRSEKEQEMHRSFRDRDIMLRMVSSSDADADRSLLLKAKCLFQKQLSKMPREYIFRQVFDDKHVNMLLVDRSSEVVGGICYRPFFEESFVEIVFLAVDYDYQVRGMGGFMMDLFKESAKLEMKSHAEGVGCSSKTVDDLNSFPERAAGRPFYIMTYADNFAIGYFMKQGFSTRIRFGCWIGFIKDYEGGTLVECRVYWEINYLRRREVVESMKEKLFRDMEKVNDCHVVHRIADYSDVKRICDIPGARDEECSTPQLQSGTALNRLISYLISDLKCNASAWPFLKPVSAEEVPDYHEHILQPMDLSMMSGKVERSEYSGIGEFIDDVRLMLSNCFRYNGKDTQYHKCAQIVQEHFGKKLAFYKHAIDRLAE